MKNDVIPSDRRPEAEAPKVKADEPLTGQQVANTGEAASVEPSSRTPQPIEGDRIHKPSRGKRILLAASLAIGLLATAIIGVFIWYTHQLSAVDLGNDEKVKITIEDGASLPDIAGVLKSNDLIRNELAFEWYVRLNGATSSLQSGAYRLGQSENVPAIVKHLTSGATDTFSITFLPGATLQKHRQVLIDAGYDSAVVDSALNKKYDHPLFASKPASADLEGYIYGETFNFAADATPEDILTYTFDYFQSVIEQNDLSNLYKKQGFTLYEGITMASIIQREVITAEDAAQVAQVFKKRYDMDMQLGSDVTYQYIADKTGQERRVDLDSPYNTRRYTGLPPGPISTPGLDALKAVGSPAPGDFLYFLSGDDDKTYFARTNEEHEKNIREHCQKKCQII